MSIAKILILSGMILIGLGILFSLGSQFHIPLGKLPGDIFIQRDRFTFSFPIVTCLIVSLLLTLILNLLLRR